VGLGPDATKGSDVRLVPLERASGPASPRRGGPLGKAVDSFLVDSEPFPGAADCQPASDGPGPGPHGASGYLADAMTSKGDALLAGRGRPSTPADLETAEFLARVARARVAQTEAQRTRVGRLPEWLARNFDHPLWKTLALRCHGCGACAAVCSTCHCFDIVDEHDRFDRGARRRNWDSCQSPKFTLHASGHNPRPTQTERLRQRVMHKFSIYPRRFDAISCTGCGRCARVCAAGMNLPAILGQLVELAEAESPGAAP
jgi:ferredoxin